MPIGSQLTDRLAGTDNTNSVSAKARAKRWHEFLRRFPNLSEMRVLDLGGTPQYWRMSGTRPKSVTTVNLEQHEADEQWIEHVVGDACAFPLQQRYDLVVSNS